MVDRSGVRELSWDPVEEAFTEISGTVKEVSVREPSVDRYGGGAGTSE